MVPVLYGESPVAFSMIHTENAV